MDEREKKLVERVLSGDRTAFAPLIDPYRDRLLGLAYRFTRDAEDAKEVAQETLLRSFKYLATFDVEKSFKAWLFQILVHAARNHGARRGREASLARSEPAREAALETLSGPEKSHEDRQMRSKLMDCLDVLSPRERDVFLLRDVEDLNVEETAAALGSSAISVRVHLSAARKKLRSRIRDKYPEILEGHRP
jgi:RNA polymerase sigma-70 factor (ECF subfamily)